MSETGGNVYDKYASRHPIERRLVDGFLTELDRLVALTGAREAHEVGCGEGELARRLAHKGLRVRGTDASAGVVAEAQARAREAELEIDFETRPIEALAPERDAAELIVCCEVLEHVSDPQAALGILEKLARPWLVVSVPREPLWRVLNLARLKYVGELGNTPGHLNHWSRRGLRELLDGRLEVVEVSSPLPWTMALCRAHQGQAARS